MTGRTHDLAAITALGIAAVLAPPSSLTLATALAAVLASLIGGIAPDIDEPTAPFWRNLPILRVFGRFAGRLLGGHRFLTHSLIGVFLFGLLAKLLLGFLSPIMGNIDRDIVWVAFMIGVLSHLVMDSFTKEGVPWLLPLPFKFGFPPLRALRFTTGKWVEASVIFPGLLILDGIMCWMLYQPILTFLHNGVH